MIGTKFIGVKENMEKEKKPGLIKQIKNRFKYDIKKVETLAGKYDVNKKVILSQDALMKAVIYSMVNLKTNGDKEIMGMLVGRREKDKIEVVDAYIGNCKSTSGYTELDPVEMVRLRKLAEERDLKLVGQWHLHPGFSTTPSGTDDDYMQNIEKFGMKTPVQLIVNSTDFNLSIMENGKRRKADFMIPPKIDTDLNLKLGFINGEYTYKDWSGGSYTSYEGVGGVTDGEVSAFCGWVGNRMFSFLSYIPLVDFTCLIDESLESR